MKKELTKFTPKIRSRHPSHSALRGKLPMFPVRCMIRFGSTTPVEQIFPQTVSKGKRVIEINSIQGIKNSASKLLMKQKFTEGGVRTCDWWVAIMSENGATLFSNPLNNQNTVEKNNLPYPIVAKHHYGSRGSGEQNVIIW